MAEMTRKRLDGIKDNCAAQSFRTLERWEVFDLIAAVEELAGALTNMVDYATDPMAANFILEPGYHPIGVARAILSRYRSEDHG